MENASKALIMAGGILIALLIITLLISTVVNISSLQQMRLTEEEREEIMAFNEQYTKYLGQYVYGTEVVTVINKSLNNKSHRITTTILFDKEGYSYTTYEYKNGKKVEKDNIVRDGKELKITNDEDNIAYDVINRPTKEDDSLTRRAFKCIDIGYDSYGRVNAISFEEKAWQDLY